MTRDYLKEWGLTPREVNQIIAENPPVLSTLSGFVAEYKLRKLWLAKRGICAVTRPTASDRRCKGDFCFQYRGRVFTLEVKSLDAPKVQAVEGGFKGTFQCKPAIPARSSYPTATD